jgi:hypothetical protein
LRCKGCGHFSNIAPEEYGNLENYKRDLKRLKELFWGVRRLRLMGGEPLLNKNVSEFISATREAFPDANIRVVTNGLLLPGLDRSVLEVMNKYYVGFDISQYPPTSRIKEKIELRCVEADVEYAMSPLVEKFFDHRNLKGNSDKAQSFEKCAGKGCHFLENGKIAVCGSPILQRKYGDLLNRDLQIADGDIIDLYDGNLDGFKINERFSSPIDFCRYCKAEVEWFEWTGNYPYLKEETNATGE